MIRLNVFITLICFFVAPPFCAAQEEPDPETMVEKAGRSIMLRQYEEALALLDEAVGLDPGNDRAYLFMAQANIGLKEYEAALESYDKALNANSKSSMAWRGKGELLLRELKYDEAQTCFENAIELNREASGAMYNLAIVYARKDDKDNCIKWLKKAVKKDPGLKLPARDEKAFIKYLSNSEFQDIVYE
ncbi:MAG: tetratricopeptide repeat protein [bacterium]|nr:tetratricopeptide repeat protein [bacterium]